MSGPGKSGSLGEGNNFIILSCHYSFGKQELLDMKRLRSALNLLTVRRPRNSHHILGS